MFQFLAFSDLHAHNFPYGAKNRVAIPGHPGLYNSSLAHTASVLDEIKEYARANGVQHILFGGDMFHTRQAVKTDVRNVILERIHSFGQYKKVITMIPGNHDMADRDGNVHSLFGFGDKTHSVLSPVTPTLIPLRPGLADVITVPYTDDLEEAKRRLQLAGELADQSSSKHKILLAHLGMQGAKVGSDYVLIKDNEPQVSDVPMKSFDICLFGHYHQHQQLFQNGWFIGATHQHNWGDANGSRGFLHVTVGEDGVSVKQIETSAPKFVVASSETELAAARPEDHVRIKVDSVENGLSLKDKFPDLHLEVVVATSDDENDDLVLDKLDPASMLQSWVETKLPSHLDSATALALGKEFLDDSV